MVQLHVRSRRARHDAAAADDRHRHHRAALLAGEKELDRINHIKISGAQTGNVFLAYRQNIQIDALINKWKSTKSEAYDFIAEDGIQHTIWIVSDSSIIEKITQLFKEEVPCTYIADGHHRAASAAKVRAEKYVVK